MITCKIILNKQSDIDYNSIIEKVLNTGDFLLSAMDEGYEILFASDKEEINEAYIRKMLRKYKIDFMIHVYSLQDRMDLDTYSNQWVITNLDRQFKIQIEKDRQPELREISRKLKLLDQVTDEMINAKSRYEEEARKIQQRQERDTGSAKSEKEQDADESDKNN